jgi:cardiolipin synthase A/B
MTGFIPGNRVTLLRNGTQFFPALEKAINSAQRQISLETYIYELDVIGLCITSALKDAAARGVRVCLLLDGFGCKNISEEFVRELQQAGIEVLFYRPKISPWTLKRNRLRRMHRKVTVIDGRIAFVGGINIIDDMNTPDHIPPRMDYAVSVEGPLLATINASARRLWRRVAWASLHRIVASRLNTTPVIAGSMRAAFVVRDNILHRHDIENAYLAAIDGAASEIVIANAYFLPGLRFRHTLVVAARRGVRVVLLLQARVEYVLLDYASRALYDQFLAAGIEIYEYHASFMHSKVAVVDRSWATVGSSNIDPFSLLLSREANVVVDDTAFAEELRQDIERSIRAGAHQVRLADWKRAPLVRRFLSWVTYGLVRFMLGILGSPGKS